MPSSAFRHALPLLTVTLVNRMASIALSLLPALLVEREAGPLAAGIAMGISRAAMIVGTLGGGVAADRYGLKPTLVTALVLTSAGVAGMGLRGPLWVLVLFAVVAQVGTGVFPTLARLVLMELVPVSEQREALAWQRSTANLGLVVSFGLGAALGTRISLLLALDALASLGAAALATRLPAARSTPAEAASTGPSGSSGSSWLVFGWATAIVGTWSLGYEAYMTATAAQLRAALGPEGVSFWSLVMVLNVVGCSALGVAAARWIEDPRWSVPVGAVLLLLGAAIGVADPGERGSAALGMTLVTAGELLFAATSQFVWMSLLPRTSRHGTVFASASTVVALLRALGGALAFPLVVDAAAPAVGMVALALPVLLLAVAAAPVWRAFRAAGGVS